MEKTNLDSLFRLSGPSQEDIDSFHYDGYIAYPDVFTDDGREGLIQEITQHFEPTRNYIAELESNPDNTRAFFIRPWNERKAYSDRLIDDPFITNLLSATIRDSYHFCHSALNLAPRGIGPIQYHFDHHHWRYENPINLAERDKYYIQILYYPNGFKRGDRNLKVIPGSHKVEPIEGVTPERILAGEFDEKVGRKLEEKRLELPPGSMVYIDARIFHGVEAKPLDSPQPYRIFCIDIFKQAGPPHLYTQEIPTEWMERTTPERKKLFTRDGYTEGCWNEK